LGKRSLLPHSLPLQDFQTSLGAASHAVNTCLKGKALATLLSMISQVVMMQLKPFCCLIFKMMLRAGSHVLDEAERSLHDALCVLQQTVQDSRVIYGGGYPEMQMAKVSPIHVAVVHPSGCRHALQCPLACLGGNRGWHLWPDLYFILMNVCTATEHMPDVRREQQTLSTRAEGIWNRSGRR